MMQQAAQPVAAELQQVIPGHGQVTDPSQVHDAPGGAPFSHSFTHIQVSTPEGGITEQLHAHEPLTPTSREWDTLSLRPHPSFTSGGDGLCEDRSARQRWMASSDQPVRLTHDKGLLEFRTNTLYSIYF